MKTLVRSSLLGAACALTLLSAKLQAADAPYIANVIIGDQIEEPPTIGGIDDVDYQLYFLTVVLDSPDPTVDELQWLAVNRNTSNLAMDETVYWPNPSGYPYIDSYWPGTPYQYAIELLAFFINNGGNPNTPDENEDVDNSYYLINDGSSDYSYFCHGCAQGNGGVYIYNP